MPRPIRIVRVRPEVRQEYSHRVETVKATLEREFKVTGAFNVAAIMDAKDAADRIQREFDEDGDPCRTYVYRNGDSVPVYAGLQRKEYGGYRGV